MDVQVIDGSRCIFKFMSPSPTDEDRGSVHSTNACRWLTQKMTYKLGALMILSVLLTCDSMGQESRMIVETTGPNEFVAFSNLIPDDGSDANIKILFVNRCPSAHVFARMVVDGMTDWECERFYGGELVSLPKGAHGHDTRTIRSELSAESLLFLVADSTATLQMTVPPDSTIHFSAGHLLAHRVDITTSVPAGYDMEIVIFKRFTSELICEANPFIARENPVFRYLSLPLEDLAFDGDFGIWSRGCFPNLLSYNLTMMRQER